MNSNDIKLQARNEVAAERANKAKDLLKAALRRLDGAQTVVANITREIADLEQAIEQGNV